MFPVAKSRPIRLYPAKAVYTSGGVNVASSDVCEGSDDAEDRGKE